MRDGCGHHIKMVLANKSHAALGSCHNAVRRKHLQEAHPNHALRIYDQFCLCYNTEVIEASSKSKPEVFIRLGDCLDFAVG
jgi:hypothetical protein